MQDTIYMLTPNKNDSHTEQVAAKFKTQNHIKICSVTGLLIRCHEARDLRPARSNELRPHRSLLCIETRLVWMLRSRHVLYHIIQKFITKQWMHFFFFNKAINEDTRANHSSEKRDFGGGFWWNIAQKLWWRVTNQLSKRLNMQVNIKLISFGQLKH